MNKKKTKSVHKKDLKQECQNKVMYSTSVPSETNTCILFLFLIIAHVSQIIIRDERPVLSIFFLLLSIYEIVVKSVRYCNNIPNGKYNQ